MSYLNVRNAPVFRQMSTSRLLKGVDFIEPMIHSSGMKIRPSTAKLISDARTHALALFMGYGVIHPRYYPDRAAEQLYAAIGEVELRELHRPYSVPMLPTPRRR